MPDPVEILIGDRSTNHVSIRVLRRERDTDDYADGNWLVTPISIRAGRFAAELPADLRADELARFRQELEPVYESLSGIATLTSLDGWITLSVACDTSGHVTITGVADDQPGTGNKLAFSIPDLDQTFLAPVIDALLEAERAFPVIGSPPQ